VISDRVYTWSVFATFMQLTMKKLITLLLIICSLQGFGQEDTTYAQFCDSMGPGSPSDTWRLLDGSSYWSLGPLEYLDYQSVLVEDSKLSVAGQRLITLNDLSEYADECYKDSILMAYRLIKTEDEYGASGTIIYTRNSPHYSGMQHWPDKYIRIEYVKEPKQPTFTGFIEWLKEKEEK